MVITSILYKYTNPNASIITYPIRNSKRSLRREECGAWHRGMNALSRRISNRHSCRSGDPYITTSPFLKRVINRWRVHVGEKHQSVSDLWSLVGSAFWRRPPDWRERWGGGGNVHLLKCYINYTIELHRNLNNSRSHFAITTSNVW